MKKLYFIAFVMFTVIEVRGQVNVENLSTDLIVVADNLNFRDEANLKSNITSILDRDEKLILLEVVQSGNESDPFYGYEGRWLKVKRLLTNEVGFVSGDYVSSQNVAYLNYQDCDRIPSGNWYGIYTTDTGVYMDQVIPEVSTTSEGYSMISSDSAKYRIFICSQSELATGQVNGRMYGWDDYIKINSRTEILRTKQSKYHIVCTGTVELDRGFLVRKSEKLFLLKTSIDGSSRKYSSQDISNLILKYGEVGYSLEFVGDLNGDDVPEIILQEANTKMGTTYYFLSDESGEIKLQSITNSYSKC